MNKEIINIPFSKLLKLEVEDMALEVIRILEKHNPELLQIQPMYELLIEDKPQIAALEVPHRGHPISKKLEQLRRQRNVHVRAIKFELVKVLTLDETGYDSTVLLLQSELVRFLDDFYDSENERVMHRKLNQFFEKIDNNEPLAEAMQSLGFIILLNNLKMNVTDVIGQLNTRSADIWSRPKANTLSIRKHVIRLMRDVFDEIRLAKRKNPALNYNKLIEELNGMLGYYDYLINIRKGVNERKAAARKAAESGTPTTKTTSTEVQTTVAGTDNGYHPSQVYTASIKKMDNNTAVGPTSSLEKKDNTATSSTSSNELSNGSLKSEDPKKAVASDWSSAQQLEEEKGTSRS